MFDDLVNDQLADADRRTSIASLRELVEMVSNTDRSLVFFVGAGASSAGNTGMPGSPYLLRQLVSEALVSAGGSHLHDDSDVG